MDFHGEADCLLQEGRIQTVPLVDFMELQRLMAQVDVNIAPLVNNGFTNCKSELKYFEAAIVDTITLATPTYTFANAIENGKNGFLCTPGQWFDTLEQIYLDKVDRAAICKAARADVEQRYCGAYFVKQIEDAYNFFASV
jgi:glycosyltransferase involved in cell wall biosynthesis